jgi:hypothetical protein
MGALGPFSASFSTRFPALRERTGQTQRGPDSDESEVRVISY